MKSTSGLFTFFFCQALSVEGAGEPLREEVQCSPGCFSTAPFLQCRVLSHNPWPASPSISTYLKTLRHLSMNSFAQHPRGQISSKSHQHSSTATSLPFGEPRRRQSTGLTETHPYSGYEFAFPGCNASATRGLAEGLILTALRLIKQLTPQQKEDSEGIVSTGSTGLTAHIITQK